MINTFSNYKLLGFTIQINIIQVNLFKTSFFRNLRFRFAAKSTRIYDAPFTISFCFFPVTVI